MSVATGDAYRHTFKTPGLYDVACDVHAGMSAQIVVTRGPHVTVADAEGQFGFASVTPGRYTLIVYAGTEPIERPVDVAAADINLDVSGE